MSIFGFLRMFSDTSVKVTCPNCSFKSEQSSEKLRKNVTIICHKCGHFFLPESD
ncbi:YnfU family zinc-binding protein [Serratia sp. (in: enterobacteria)]|uniref:YnfU family zinc-binding protein n=1 Tax=Serratia sp. (in: enterobacteria) TaxID=616 RepID=UPI00398A3731